MIGVEFVESKASRAPLSREKFHRMFNLTKNYGVLFGSGGHFGNVLRVKPPMCFTKQNVDVAVDIIDKSIKEANL